MVNEPTYEELLMQNSLLKKQNKYLSEHTERVENQNDKLTETKKSLTRENKYLTEENKKLLAENKQLSIDYNWALQQLKLSKKKIYGASAEKIAADYEQLSFFNEKDSQVIFIVTVGADMTKLIILNESDALFICEDISLMLWKYKVIRKIIQPTQAKDFC